MVQKEQAFWACSSMYIFSLSLVWIKGDFQVSTDWGHLIPELKVTLQISGSDSNTQTS